MSGTRAQPSPAALGLLLLGCAALFSARPAHPASTTWHVSPLGSDMNPGTEASPFRQIRRALQVVAAGDTILVADGSYLGFTMNGKIGSQSAPITIRASGEGAVVTKTTDRSDNRDTIFITHCAWVVVDGLRAFDGNRAAVRIDASPSVTVRNGVFGNNGTWGIFTDFSDDTVLENNECYGSVNEHGIYVSNSSDRPIVRGNYCHDNRGCGIQINADVFAGGDGITTGALVENNVLVNNGVGGGAAINLDGVQDSVIRNNLIVNNHASGIACFRINGAEGPRGLLIAHNTVDQPSDGRWCLLLWDTSGPITVRNNILFTRHSFRGSILYESAADVANTDSDFNVLSKASPNNGSTVYTLAQWQALGHEPNSLQLTEGELWANALEGDYRLAEDSPAVDRGQTLAEAAVDLQGAPRPQGAASDPGCYEAPGAGGDQTPPAPPTGVQATPGDAQATVSWAASPEPDLAGYHVYRSGSAAGPWTRQTADLLTTTAFTQAGLTNGVTYWYAVTALDTSGNESGLSTAVSATPAAPVAVVLKNLVLSPNTVQGGLTSRGTITVSPAAPSGGVVVALASSRASAIVPPSVTVPAGSDSAAFTIQTTTVTATRKARITATLAARTISRTLTITP